MGAYNHFRDLFPTLADELSGAVYEALGAASMAWDPQPSTQVFDSEKAAEIGRDLLDKVVGILG